MMVTVRVTGLRMHYVLMSFLTRIYGQTCGSACVHLEFDSYQKRRLLQSDGTASPFLYKHPEYDCTGQRLNCTNRPTHSQSYTHVRTEMQCVIKMIITQ